MAKINKIEEEIEAIRLKLYEETRNLTREEEAKRLSDKTRKLAVQYGFNIVSSAKKL